MPSTSGEESCELLVVATNLTPVGRGTHARKNLLLPGFSESVLVFVNVSLVQETMLAQNGANVTAT